VGRVDRRVLIGTGIAALVVLLVWYVVLWSPRNRAYNTARTRAEAAQSQVSQLQAQLGRLQADSRQRPQLEAELAKLQAAIPSTPQLAQIFLQIDNAALQSGVTLTSIAPSPPAATAPSTGAPASTGTPPPSISVSLALGGGYYQILDFIDRLDALPRLIVLNTVTLSGGSAASTGPELTASITAHMFVSQLPPTPSATGAAGTTGTTTTTAASGVTTTTTVGATTTTTAAKP
jgi:Tfp pilus assembly protein PilO